MEEQQSTAGAGGRESKVCPYCRENIPIAAVKCRYCAEWLHGTPGVPAPEQKKSSAWLILLIVGAAIFGFVVMVSIIAAIAIPTLLVSKMAANEASAISALRTMSSAQELYWTRNEIYGDYFNLCDGDRNKYIDERLAMADPDHPRHTGKSGYSIDIWVSEDGSDWYAIATPELWEKDGARNFKIGREGIIYYNETRGDTQTWDRILGRD